MARRRLPLRAARAAYTLIELTLVVMLTAVLAAVAAPRYQSALAKYRVDAAACRVAADLRMVQQLARKTSAAQPVEFDPVADSYTAASMPNMNARGGAYTVNLADSEYAADLVSADFDGDSIVEFDIYGRPSAAGTIVVQSGGLQHSIEVDETGTVSIP